MPCAAWGPSSTSRQRIPKNKGPLPGIMGWPEREGHSGDADLQRPGEGVAVLVAQ